MAKYEVILTDEQEQELVWLGTAPQALVDQKLQDMKGQWQDSIRIEKQRLFELMQNTDPAVVDATIAKAKEYEAAKVVIVEEEAKKEQPVG